VTDGGATHENTALAFYLVDGRNALMGDKYTYTEKMAVTMVDGLTTMMMRKAATMKVLAAAPRM
jgi:hypothetical protein